MLNESDRDAVDAEPLGIAHPKKRAMLAALARTGNVSAAARAAGVGRRTHYQWLADDPEYRPAVEDAMEEAGDVLEAAARRRALTGSDTLMIFLLKAIRPEKFRDRGSCNCRVIDQPRVTTVAEKLERLPVNVARRILESYPEAEKFLPPDSQLLVAGEAD